MLKTLNTKLRTPLWLFILIFLVFVLRIPSFFEPYSYGDEMIYLAIGNAIRQGIPLYSQIHDNKPPFLYILAAVAGNLFWFKAIMAMWHMVTIFIFWKLTEVLFPKKTRSQILATSIFAVFTTIPLLEGNIVNSEIFMVGFVILAFYILLAKTSSFRNLFFAGTLFSASALFKIPAAFDFPVIFLYWVISENKLTLKKLFSLIKKSWPLIAGFLAPILFTFFWFYFSGSIKEYLIAAFLQNFGYLSSFRPGDIEKPFYIKNGPLLIRAGIVFITGVAIYLLRKKLTKKYMFATIWLFLSLFAVTLSERPYPHYLIQSVAPLSILFTIFISDRTKEQIYAIIPLFIAFLTPVYYKFWYYPTAPYYERFIKLASGKINKSEYLLTFGSQVPRNYKLTEFVLSSTTPKEKIFIWGDGVPIYALSKRLPPIKYVADYHIKDFYSEEKVISSLENNLPSLIIRLPEGDEFPALNYILNQNYGLAEVIDGAEVWKLLSAETRDLLRF